MTKALVPKTKPAYSSVPLLSAHWRNLVVVNYEVDPGSLKPFLPPSTELDDYKKKTYVSLVGFLFENTKAFGFLPLGPFRNFEEVNLRFYIKRKVGNEVRRAVCFIREVVPYRAITWGARFLYNEPYVTYPTRNRIEIDKKTSARQFSYEWKGKEGWMGLNAQTEGNLLSLKRNSIEEFILEHYWGYTNQRNGSVKEYRVSHVPWRYWKTKKVQIDKAVRGFYGQKFRGVLSRRPHSTFIAEGSLVSIYSGQKTES